MFDSNKQYTQGDLPGEVFNAGSGAGGNIVNYNGRAVKVGNNGNGTRQLQDLGDWNTYQTQQSGQKAQDAYKAATDTAVQGLSNQKQNLPQQYADLLKTVTGEYQPLINQTTASTGAELSRRGLTPDSALFQKETQGALQPVYGQEAANAQQIGAGSISDLNSLASQIAGLQTGVAGTAANLPLQYGQLAQSAQVLPSQIQLAIANANNANTSARFIPIPNVGIYDLQTGKIQSSTGLSNTGRTIVSVNP